MVEHVTLTAPFVQPDQQRQADFMGMYLFIGAETMMFGSLVALVFAYRTLNPRAAVEAASHLQLSIGAANTAVLLTSSLSVALAVVAARSGVRRATAALLGGAIALGLIFLGLKGWEYWLDYAEGLMPLVGPANPLADHPARLFINLYFVATALHALHMIVGLGLLGWTAGMVLRRQTAVPGQAIVVEMSGLYWHFVDVVWVFLFPIFYLARS